MLAAQVKAGKLPPLEQRIPAHPLVANASYDGYEGPGPYGSTWHHIHTEADLADWKMVDGYATFIRWRFDCKGLEPGLAESWEFNRDGSVFTLHLRKGLHWSDGSPYTSADFAFYYQLCQDDRYYYTPPVWCLVDGKPMQVETPDPCTIVMKFAGPNWLVPLWLATGYWWSDLYNMPSRYMKQFDPDYNPKYKDFDVFTKKDVIYANPDRPTMWPWKMTRIENSGFRVVFERNPYYWVVDKLGRQLPYIDRVESSRVADPQVAVLKILSGEVDCQWRGTDLDDLQLYLQGQQEGHYRVRRWRSTSGAVPAFLVNWSPPDPVLRKIFRDRRFRKALSVAIDRNRVNVLVYHGLLQPQAATISAESWHFNSPEGRALFNQWKETDAEYDPRRANAWLDEMGLDKRDAEGYRLRPDGKRLTIVFDTMSGTTDRTVNDVSQMVAKDWRALGLDIVLNTPPYEEVEQRRAVGTFEISTHPNESEIDLCTYPNWIFPTEALYWHPLVGKWYQTGGEKGEAPTPPMTQLLDLYDRIKAEPDMEKRNKLVLDAIRIHIKDGPFTIGAVGRDPRLVIVSNHFHNVARDGILGPWAIGQPATQYPEQCWIDPPDKGGPRP